MKQTLKHDAAKAITDKFFTPGTEFYGTEFIGGYAVSTWRPEIREAFPLALIACVEKWTGEDGMPTSHADAGEDFVYAIEARHSFGYTHSQFEGYGKWLEAVEPDIRAALFPVSPDSAETVDYKTLYEESQRALQVSKDAYEALSAEARRQTDTLAVLREKNDAIIEFNVWIGETLLGHAVDKDWCGEYEEFLDSARRWNGNERMRSLAQEAVDRMIDAGQRTKKFEGLVRDRIGVVVYVDRMVRAEAKYEDDAEDAISDADEGSDSAAVIDALREAIANGDVDWETLETEILEVKEI